MSSSPSSWRSVSFRTRAAISGSTWARVRVFSMRRPHSRGQGRVLPQSGTERSLRRRWTPPVFARATRGARLPGIVDDQDDDLARIRQAIEALDRSLLALLRERQQLGQQAARAKI